MRKTKANVKIFNLDVIISVEYRVNSIMGVTFRKWANEVLKEYLLTGYVIDKDRNLVTIIHFIIFCVKILHKKIKIVYNISGG